MDSELRAAIAATPWAQVPDDKLRAIADLLCDVRPAGAVAMTEYVQVPRLLASCKALVAAMRRYEVEVEGDAPQHHIDMIAEAEAAIIAATPEAQVAPQGGGEVAETIYVEARECESCGHAGLNDSHATHAACLSCDWTGPSPVEDRCPGCNSDGVMTASCPKCEWRYRLLASEEIAIPTTQPAGTLSGDAEQVARGDDERAEDEYVIERMGRLLAEIALIVNGPHPNCGLWSYHDLPEKVAALRTQAPDPLGVVDVELATLLFNAGYSDGHHYTVDGGYVDVAIEDRMTHHRGDVEDLIAEYRAALSAKEGQS